MLTLEENGWNFKYIKIYTFLNIFPIQLDIKTGKIRNLKSTTDKIRLFLWKVLFGCGIVHCIFMLARLFQSTILEPEKYFRWDHFVIHFCCAVVYSVLYFTGFCLFRKNPEESVLILNQFFVERENPVQKMVNQEQEEEREGEQELQINSSGRDRRRSTKTNLEMPINFQSGSGVPCRPLLTWPPQYSLDEILARTYSLIVQGTVFFVLVILALDPNRPMHFYSVLPPEYQNVYSYFLLLVVEALSLTMITNFSVFSVTCSLLFFGKCHLEFEQINLQIGELEEKFQNRPIQNRDVKREIWILRQMLKEIKEVEVFIELFNRCFPFCIFAYKLLCLSVSVLFYFFTIRHGGDFPFLGFFTAYVAVAMTLTYGIVYEKAFSIPQKMQGLKNYFLLSAHKSTIKPKPKPNSHCNCDPKLLESFRAEIEREVGAIQNVAVKVASFYTLERESTPNFVDFVFQNVVNLLVTFPR